MFFLEVILILRGWGVGVWVMGKLYTLVVELFTKGSTLMVSVFSLFVRPILNMGFFYSFSSSEFV